MKRVVLLLALAFLLAPAAALADAVLDFTVPPTNPGASISYDGQGGPLIGSGITVTGVTGIGTPLNDGVFVPIAGGLLNFTTGSLAGSQNSPDEWYFGGGPNSFISITGVIQGMNCYYVPPGQPCGGELAETAGPSYLLYGGFGNASVYSNSGVAKIAGASFWDYKCYDLLAFFGLQEYAFTQMAGDFNVGFRIAGGIEAPSGFTSVSVGSGDVNNAVPEPGTLALLGTGLLSIAGLVRRKLTS